MSTQGRILLYIGAIVAFGFLVAFGVTQFRSASADSGDAMAVGLVHACVQANGSAMGDGLTYLQGDDSVTFGAQDPGSDCPLGFTPIHWNAEGPQGLEGPQGIQGPEGPEGPEGPPGADADPQVSIIGGGGEHNDHLKTHQIVYFPMFHGDASTDLTEVEQVIPLGGYVGELNVRVSDAPRNGEWVFTIVGGSGGPLSCTIAGAATSCSVSGPATEFAPGGLLALRADPDFSPKGGVHVRWTAAFTYDTD